MNDDLDDLKRAMQEATPDPQPSTKAAHLAAAMKNFDAAQGSADAARLNSDRPGGGLLRGVRRMFETMSMRGALTGGTALAALGLVLVIPNLQDVLDRPAPLTLDDRYPKSVVGLDDVSGTNEVMEDAADAIVPPVPEPSSAPVLSKRHAFDAQTGVAGRLFAPNVDHSGPLSVPQAEGEAFPDADANPLKVTAEEPVSTFSVDVDTASYAVIRDSLSRGALPPAGAVRIEEMVNYFPYDYPAPEAGQAFRPMVSVAGTPWNAGTQLVHIALQGAVPEVAVRPPLNLVFLIDTSGSMNQPDKLPLLKQSFRLMLGQLRAEDSVAIVAYAGSVGQVLAPTPAEDSRAILAALDQLQSGGGTAGQAGLQQAYTLAETMTEDGDVSRVILATDGDFNVGLSDPEALKDYIAEKRDSGTYLSVLGFGRGNLDDATMQALAQNGNGQAAYIDTLGEARKVLVDQLTGALFPIASDVKIQVEFNPAEIAEYRLIGYETRALQREDFNNDKVDAGDIGAGHQVTALYEVTPVGSPARLTEPLRYGAQVDGERGELGFLRLRYKTPGEDNSKLIEAPITKGGDLSDDARFGLAIVGFGQLLQRSTHVTDWGWEDAIALATEARGADPFGYRQEAINLMRLAQSLQQN